MVIGLRQFSFLTDLELTGLISNKEKLMQLKNVGDRLTSLMIWIGVFGIAGLLISGLIMYQLTRNIKYYWTTILVVLLIGYCATRFKLLDMEFIKGVMLFIGGLFSRFGLVYPFLINGLLLTGLGLLIFYNKWTKKQILRLE